MFHKLIVNKNRLKVIVNKYFTKINILLYFSYILIFIELHKMYSNYMLDELYRRDNRELKFTIYVTILDYKHL